MHPKRAGSTQTTFPRTRLDAECKKRRDLRPVAAIEVVNFPGLIPSRFLQQVVWICRRHYGSQKLIVCPIEIFLAGAYQIRQLEHTGILYFSPSLSSVTNIGAIFFYFLFYILS